MKKYLWMGLIAFGAGVAGAYTFVKWQQPVMVMRSSNGAPDGMVVSTRQAAAMADADFVKASKTSSPCVVFIKTISNNQPRQADPYDFFSMFDPFGRRGPVSSSGSGVILSADGYIVTNNHVVDEADQIEVILNNNKHSYAARLIGRDPSTDIALLKIEAKNLPAIAFGNSDQVNIGEWVLAVGNPFNLTSTVTAGIVSAKGRNINIVNNQFPIESFIQTDAAINPGNSGGALVNLNGELIGINTAIASNTGSYNGYGFAIPANIVAKIVKDLIEFGEVQRGFTGMDVQDINSDMAARLGNDINNGIYVAQVFNGGPADKAGIQPGDIIIRADGKAIDSKSIFDEQVAYHRPGDKIKITTLRSGKEIETSLTLINREGNTDITRREAVTSDVLGADFELISKVEKERYGISGGVKVTNIRNGRMRSLSLPEGFIFTKLNGKTYGNVKDFIRDFENVQGRIIIEGMSPNGVRQTLSFYSY